MPKTDIYEVVTNQIIDQLEQGVVPWQQAWSAGPAVTHRNIRGNAYSGVNVLLTWIASAQKGFTQTRWLTYKQAKEQGGNVRKGEKGTTVVFAKQVLTDKEDDNGKKIGYFVHKGYTVFNIEQCDGLEHLREGLTEPKPEPIRCVETDALIAATGAVIKHDGAGRAYYKRDTDDIHMPVASSFNTMPDYYSTVLHELVHWTGAKHRLDRIKGKSFGDKDYAFEELCAELGSAFLCAQMGFDSDLQHASYIGSWLQALKNDKKYIFRASSQASKAAEYINQFQEQAAIAA